MKIDKKWGDRMWIAFALMSALFASITAILAKIGIENVNSNLATAIRTTIVLVMAWSIVAVTGQFSGIGTLSSKTWLFLALSGIATGASWLCYYRAIQMADVSKVVPIDKLSIVLTMILAFVILGEKADVKTIIGGILITIGTFVLIL